MPMEPEERQLQIKLAQLNARLQIYIASVFGFFALCAVFLIAAYQSVNTWLYLVAIICFIPAVAFIYKTVSCHEELEELK